MYCKIVNLQFCLFFEKHCKMIVCEAEMKEKKIKGENVIKLKTIKNCLISDAKSVDNKASSLNCNYVFNNTRTWQKVINTGDTT